MQRLRPAANELLTTKADGDLLLGALRRYLSRHGVLHGGRVSPEEHDGPSSHLRPYYSTGIENSGLKKETSKTWLPKMGRTQDPLTSVDGMCLKAQLDEFLHQKVINMSFTFKVFAQSRIHKYVLTL